MNQITEDQSDPEANELPEQEGLVANGLPPLMGSDEFDESVNQITFETTTIEALNPAGSKVTAEFDDGTCYVCDPENNSRTAISQQVFFETYRTPDGDPITRDYIHKHRGSVYKLPPETLQQATEDQIEHEHIEQAEQEQVSPPVQTRPATASDKLALGMFALMSAPFKACALAYKVVTHSAKSLAGQHLENSDTNSMLVQQNHGKEKVDAYNGRICNESLVEFEDAKERILKRTSEFDSLALFQSLKDMDVDKAKNYSKNLMGKDTGDLSTEELEYVKYSRFLSKDINNYSHALENAVETQKAIGKDPTKTINNHDEFMQKMQEWDGSDKVFDENNQSFMEKFKEMIERIMVVMDRIFRCSGSQGEQLEQVNAVAPGM